MQPKMGGKPHLRLNNGERPIANKYREGKMNNFEKRVKQYVKLLKGKRLKASDNYQAAGESAGERREGPPLFFLAGALTRS